MALARRESGTGNRTGDTASEAAQSASDRTDRPPLRLGRTLRFALRGAWDALGFVCAMSLTLFIGMAIPVTVALQPGTSASAGERIGWSAAAVMLALGLLPPLYAGACHLTHRILTHDEPSYLDLWRGFYRLYRQAVLLGAAQLAVASVLVANALFYLRLPGFPFLLLAVLFLYLLLFWGMNALYHWPLLVAGAAGVIRREDGGPPGLRAVFRNGFLLAFSAPGFTLALLLIIMSVTIPLALSGVGMALLSFGFTAFLTTQATRDQLARFGVLPPPPDPDEPVVDEGWKIE